MRTNSKQLFLTVLLYLPVIVGSMAATPQANQNVGTEYILMAEDVLEISVWKEKDLHREVLIRPDGKISFPLVGHLTAAGRTPEQLQQLIRKKLKSYISNPVVNVSVIKPSGNKVYVVGKVNRPGVYVVGQFIDVMQALSLAGGLTAYADGDDIAILRRINGKEIAFSFDYDDVEDGDELHQNILLKSGDVVVVP